MRRAKHERIASLWLGLVLLAMGPEVARATGGDRKTYLEDYEFLVQTVEQHGAALESKKTEWKPRAGRLEAQFARAASDTEHVRNVMELLALLEDSHTGVTRTGVDGLPGKFDGLYGGGLWFGWDGGKFVLRGVMKGHPAAGKLTPGSVLVGIDEKPVWYAMALERMRIARYQGISTNHSLYASLGNRMLPFGDAQSLRLTFVDPELERITVDVPRWGPGGKAFYPSEVQLPEGLEYAKGAVSTKLRAKWSEAIGYLRITGGMNSETVSAVHRELDRLRGIEALLLDCRSMGGGSDTAAWEIAGRFFPKGVGNGRHGRIAASGSWQFDGPVVMLQNENMVSSAETFTWAMSETGRAITIGRPTGGWGIIPRGYDLPSGLASFRLGVNDRPTPIRGVHTEGVGWPADLLLPFSPEFCSDPDPARTLGMDALGLLHAGLDIKKVRADWVALLAGEISRFRKAGKGYEKPAGWFDVDRLAARVLRDIKAELKMETALLATREGNPADAIGAEQRVEVLAERARAAGLDSEASRIEKGARSLKREAAAQRSLLDLLRETILATETEAVGTAPVPAERARKAWLRKHGKTDTGRFIAGVWDRSNP